MEFFNYIFSDFLFAVTQHKQNDYYCSVCKRYLGDDMELKHACLQPEYCQHCGQALDWSDIV